MTIALGMVVAGLMGFVSLSYEILWFRVYSYATGGSPITFGLLLGIYLSGLAIGGDVAGKLCRNRTRRTTSDALAFFAFIASAAAFFVIPLMAASTRSPGKGWLALIAVLFGAAFFGALLPLISHMGVEPDTQAGEKVSYIYSANILGAVCGSLFTGFVFSDVMTTQQISLCLALAGLAFTALIILRSESRRALHIGALAVAAAVFVGSTPFLYDGLYEKLQFKSAYRGQRFAHIVENKHGVAAVTDSGATFGGGAYDGYVSTSLVHNPNGIERAYLIPAIHPHPRKVLIIGLSTGAWSQVLANSPLVESMTVVEINPGYLELIRQYPSVRSLLVNPKVRIVLDDGRRWLVRNPNQRFDFILSNTTFHYRANTTNLLSAEFMRMVHRHLLPRGIFYFNTTGSQDAMKTAFTEFPHGIRINNFVAVSDSGFSLDPTRWREVLAGYRVDGNPVFDLTKPLDRLQFEKTAKIAETIHTAPTARGLETRESVLSRIPNARVVTDDNMLPEWRTLILRSQ